MSNHGSNSSDDQELPRRSTPPTRRPRNRQVRRTTNAGSVIRPKPQPNPEQSEIDRLAAEVSSRRAIEESRRNRLAAQESERLNAMRAHERRMREKPWLDCQPLIELADRFYIWARANRIRSGYQRLDKSRGWVLISRSITRTVPVKNKDTHDPRPEQVTTHIFWAVRKNGVHVIKMYPLVIDLDAHYTSTVQPSEVILTRETAMYCEFHTLSLMKSGIAEIVHDSGVPWQR